MQKFVHTQKVVAKVADVVLSSSANLFYRKFSVVFRSFLEKKLEDVYSLEKVP